MTRFVFPLILALILGAPVMSWAQSVCLPAPRLLTILPMGGQAGSEFEVEVSGESLDSDYELLFSDPRISAERKRGADGKGVPHQFVVRIASDAPIGVHEARAKSRLGVSASRAFTVGKLRELVRAKPNVSLETAMALPPNVVCNAFVSPRAFDHYFFEAPKGRRFVIDCAASQIDSKLQPVVMVSDASGNDLVVNRTGGAVDFTVPEEGKYFIKVHGLTFQGGATHFYRLAFRDMALGEGLEREPSTRTVSSFSWTGRSGLPPEAPKFAASVSEERVPQAVRVNLPCEITGRFYPAARVDTYEFEAKKGEVWWAEVGSERLGLGTDPFLVAQRSVVSEAKERWVDVVELNDIASPMKPSSNGYSYDGPPYDGGSADPLGKIEIPADGRYRVQIRDLFGGTKADPRNRYTLVLRRASPDFALAGWALHMNLRNGDRNALSKPMNLRAGATMAMEVGVVRKDGFTGEIDLFVEGLPPGVRASGLRIPAGKNRGLILLTATEDAPEGLGQARLMGRAMVEGKEVVRPVAVGSMAWPVRDATQEIPKPRLLADSPVSVTRGELAPVTIRAEGEGLWEATQGEKVTVPFAVTWRSEFSGTSLRLKATGEGFESAKEIEVPLKGERVEAVFDLAALKVAPGEYTVALCGPGVVKYRYHPEAVKAAELAQKEAEQRLASLAEEGQRLNAQVIAAAAEEKPVLEQAVKEMAQKMKAAEVAKAEALKRMKSAEETAAPKDTVDIVWSEPFRLVVKAAPQK